MLSASIQTSFISLIIRDPTHDFCILYWNCISHRIISYHMSERANILIIQHSVIGRNRFEFFVRSHLSRAKVKDILSAAVPSKYTITGAHQSFEHFYLALVDSLSCTSTNAFNIRPFFSTPFARRHGNSCGEPRQALCRGVGRNMLVITLLSTIWLWFSSLHLVHAVHQWTWLHLICPLLRDDRKRRGVVLLSLRTVLLLSIYSFHRHFISRPFSLFAAMEVLGERDSDTHSDEASSGGQGLLAQHLR